MRRFLTVLTIAGTGGWLVPPSAAQAFETVERGDRGADVRLVQRALSALGIRTRADGVFGTRTARSVRRYERRERIMVDGRVSRGQARGMLRRADMDTAVLDRDASRAGADDRVAAPRSSTFPIQGAWRQGDGFGERSGRHHGTDLLADCGTPLVAAEGGKVVFTGRHGAAGQYIVIRSERSGEDHVYMHLQGAPEGARGDAIDAGERIGAVGRSGNATTCHLHFEIWTAPGWHEGGAARDPAPDLRAWEGRSAS